MRRIILGLVTTLVLGGAVLGATQAFFSDTETSTDNVFVAGSVDLTVDHAFASYNGDDCTTDCRVEENALNLVTNGDFEQPVVSQGAGWDAFAHSGVNGWVADWVNVVGGSQPAEANIELHRGVSGWLSQGGQQHAELDSDWDGPTGSISNEQALIKLYQDIPTTAGKKYELRYWHSYRPGASASENEMVVRWDGIQINNITDADGTGKTQTSWKEYVHEVLGDGSPIRLEFIGSGPNNSLGVFLDSVTLKEKTCTSSQVGGICNLWEEKDLTQNDVFWNFSDIKPGDYGRNVISLHVEDNDAYACLLVDDVVNDENDATEPEVESGDTPNPNTEGELSNFIQAFAWNDLDQDGFYEPGDGETILYGPGNLFDLLDGIDVGDANSGTPLISGVTKYVGFAWCVGTMSLPGEAGMTCDGSSPDLNVAQTDIMTASVVAYAEQVRNNAGFECSNALLGNQ